MLAERAEHDDWQLGYSLRTSAQGVRRPLPAFHVERQEIRLESAIFASAIRRCPLPDYLQLAVWRTNCPTQFANDYRIIDYKIRMGAMENSARFRMLPSAS